MKRIAVFLLACLLLTACDTAKRTWRDTKGMFDKYVDIDPEIDLKNEGIDDKGLQKLARLFGPVDQKLEVFLREIQSQDTPPEAEWSEGLLSRFQWLTGLAVLDAEGTVLAQYPPVGMRAVDFTPLLEFKDRYKVRQLAASIQTDELGTLIYVAMPYYKNNEFSGLVVGYFDPRSLIDFCPDPGQLYIIYPDGVLWPGSDQALAEAMLAYAWKSELKADVQGETTVNGVTYAWQARWIGQIEIVYVTEISSAREQAEKAVEEKKAEEAQKPVEEQTTEDAAVSQTVTQTPAQGGAPATETVTDAVTVTTDVKDENAAGAVTGQTVEEQSVSVSESFLEYVIKPGDTLSKIAESHKVTVADIEQANANLDPKDLKIGAKVLIPRK